MEYRLVRQKFVELSGRYDLVVDSTNFEDGGADFFLDAGQKYLDRLLDTGKMIARYPVVVTAGTFIAKSIGIRSIREVWAGNVDGKVQLQQCTLQQLRTEYGEEFSDVTQGVPYYYAPATFRPYPDAVVSGGSIDTLTIAAGGATYTAGTLSATGGGGTGFAGTYAVTLGVITSTTITNRGTGYTTAPTIVISHAGNGAASITASISALTGSYNVSDLVLDNTHYTYNGIVIMPPPDGTYTVEILGLFYSPTLTATLAASVWTQTKSYWTEVHPDILIAAAIYKLHALYHNTAGAVDYKASVLEDIAGIDRDSVDEDIGAGSLQMGG